MKPPRPTTDCRECGSYDRRSRTCEEIGERVRNPTIGRCPAFRWPKDEEGDEEGKEGES